MSMDLALIQFLFSAVFIMIGAIAFNVSSLISGYNIYRELDSLESTVLSISSGIIIFLASPILFVLYIEEITKIFTINVVASFFLVAIGFGMIFGGLSILELRLDLIAWFKHKSRIPLIVKSYAITWDLFFGSIRKGGTVRVYTKSDDKEILEGNLVSFSGRKEQREIVIERFNENDRLLIPDSYINFISIPQSCFEKHYECMTHLGQGVYYIVIALGSFFVSHGLNITQSYISMYTMKVNMGEINIEGLNIEGFLPFYNLIKISFFVAAALIAFTAIFIAKKDFKKWSSFRILRPTFILICLLFVILTISTYYWIYPILIYFILIILIPITLYIWLTHINPRKDLISLIEQKDFKTQTKLKKGILNYLRLNLHHNDESYKCIDDNGEESSCVENIEGIINEETPKIVKFVGVDTSREAEIKSITLDLISLIKEFKKKKPYLEGEDINLINFTLDHLDARFK